MEPAGKIAAADGLELALYEWSREGVPMLLLHGFGNDAHVWEDFAPEVAPFYRVLALDQRGHGESDRDPEGRYDHASMARDVEAALDALGIERVVIVGHSMGGRVAIRFAGLHPEKMAGLVIVDSGVELDTRGTTRIRDEAVSSEPVFDSVRAYEAVLSRNYPETKPATIQRLARQWLRERPDGKLEPKLDPAFMKGRAYRSAADLEAWARQEKDALESSLRAMPCPTLLVRGAASDVLAPEEADRIVDDLLPDETGKLEVVAAAGHSVMLDNPEGFFDAVSGFVLGDG